MSQKVFSSGPFKNEADVETQLVLPLFNRLGYPLEDVRAKYPVTFHEGRRGRKAEADFVVFASAPHDRNSSLLVCEAKAPTESLDDARGQAESYATWLRAPFYLLTNGLQIQLWQLQATYESHLVLEMDVTELTVRFGDVALLCSRAAMLQHCEKLKIKNLVLGDVDCTQYLREVLKAIGDSHRLEQRTFEWDGPGETIRKTLSIRDIWCQYPRGAVVAAARGLGKTTLAQSIAVYASSSNVDQDRLAVPIYVDARDWSSSREALDDYIARRLSGTVSPLSSLEAARAWFKRTSVSLCIDHIEGCSDVERRRICGDAGTFALTYGSCRLWMFCTDPRSVTTSVLPRIQLLPLDDEQAVELVSGYRRVEEWEARAWLEGLPPLIRKYSSSPLLLRKICETFDATGQLPRDMVAVLDQWIEELLARDGAGEFTRLSRLRVAGVAARLDGGNDALSEYARQNARDESTVDDLFRCGLLRRQAHSWNFAHDALRDLLVARALAKVEPSVFERECRTEINRCGLSVAALLIAMLPAGDRRSGVFECALSSGVRSYMALLHDDAETDTKFDDVHGALGQVLDGFVAFADLLRPPTRAMVLGPALAEGTAIAGDLDAKRHQLKYRYEPGPAARAVRKTLAWSSEDYGSHWVNLSAGPAALRVLGHSDMFDRTIALIRAGRALGGPVWQRERIRRTREIVREPNRGGRASTAGSLRNALLEIGKHSSFVRLNMHAVEVDLLLSDVDALVAANGPTFLLDELDLPCPDLSHASLGFWWARYSSDRLVEYAQDRETRVQTAYRELVEEAFAERATIFSEYARMPIQIRQVVGAPRGSAGPPLVQTWRPVESWSESFVTTTFESEPDAPDFETEFAELKQALERVGRPYEHVWLSQVQRLRGPWARGGDSVFDEVVKMVVTDLERALKP